MGAPPKLTTQERRDALKAAVAARRTRAAFKEDIKVGRKSWKDAFSENAMALKEKLQSDLTQSMRDRNELRSGTIRMVLTAIKNEEVSGKEARELSDAEVITVLSREAKKRREAAEAYEQAGAKGRSATEKAEGEIIATYLPAQLSESEIKELINAAIAETGASGPQQMGLVMKSIQPKIAGRADGGLISSLVKAALK